MPTLDPHVSTLLDRPASPSAAADEDALIAALESDSALDGFREQRLQQLHAELAREKQLRADDTRGTHVAFTDEKALMDVTTETKLCVVHFLKPDFGRCRVMDGHLAVSGMVELRVG